MVTKNLNRVLKTVLVGSVKPTASADRVGSGTNGTIDTLASFLSLGLFLLPRLSEPEPRSRMEVADPMSMPPNEIEHGQPESVSGPTARRCSGETRLSAIRGPFALARTSPTARPTATPAVALWQPGTTSQDRYPGSHHRLSQFDRDCQSPDWFSNDRDSMAKPKPRSVNRIANLIAAAAK